LFDAIENDLFMTRLQQIAWSCYRDKPVSEDRTDTHSDVARLLSDTGLREIVANTAVRLFEKSYNVRQKSSFDTSIVTARQSKDENLDYIRKVRVEWEQGIREELMVIAKEQSRPFARLRAPGKFQEFIETGDSSVLRDGNEDSVRFLFDSEDLLETATSIRSPNMKPTATNRLMGLVKLSLRTPTLEEFALKYKELSAGMSQLGFDERHLSGGTKFCFQRHEEGEALAYFGTSIEARRFMRRGVPPALRSRVWRASFGLPPDVTCEEDNRRKVLLSYCEHLDVLTDRLYMFDVDNVVDDPRFFVFEEEVQETIMCFSRDDWVRSNAVYEVHLPVLSTIETTEGGGSGSGKGGDKQQKGSGSNLVGMGAEVATGGGKGASAGGANKPNSSLSANPLKMPSHSLPSRGRGALGGNNNNNNNGDTMDEFKDVIAPTSAVQPFLGLAIYVAPLCYVFRDRAALYSAHKILWSRLWCKMNIISADEGTLLHVCATFENLLMSVHPSLFLHMVKVGVQPLLIAMPWLQFGFVGLLEVEQVLHLWDRLVGYDDTCLLALLAVGVFMIRAENVMATTVPAEVCSILMEGTKLRVVPILQMMLFSDGEQTNKK
jgi:hypothetical protein